MKKSGFTLIEMMIAIAIFAIISLFLYQTYNSFHRSGKQLQHQSDMIVRFEKIKKVLYLDFALSLDKNATIINQERDEDTVILHTSNSLHKRINPYVAYVLKQQHLYRLEGLKKFIYPFDADTAADVEDFGEVTRFRVFSALKKDNNNTQALYLLDARFKNMGNVLYKVHVLNQ